MAESSNPHLLEQNLLQALLPVRNNDAHKGTFGSVAIIGGDTGMAGAVLLTARAALHSGAGRVYAAMLCKNAPSVDICQPEIMLRSPQAITQLSQLDCVVIGTGLGQSDKAIELLEYWLAQNIPLLLDADALNLTASHLHLESIIISRDAETVITPHAGEAARLLDVSVEHIQQNRTETALKLAKNLNATCVLKGAGTICAHHDGSWFINSTGNVGLASGGTGDVLSGIIGSLMAQGLTGIEAAKLGVYVHGAAADALVKAGIGPAGLTASEVALEARKIINQTYTCYDTINLLQQKQV
jgi:ADP-dependent NAD(P)H-hydrate dehydratase / NAD(P)H-hydrate epimerase